jgi:N-acetylglutamate synthase-like GNAT family acetyltransferase
MTTPKQQVRRATVEDLQKLVPLWQQENLPWQDLEKRFKEFQVVEGGDSELLAAVGLQIEGHEGRLHSEVFAHAEQADVLRELLWERTKVVANNFGLVRLWTQFATPFWNQSGFQYATAELLSKLPAGFGGDPRPWKFVQLRAEAAAPLSIDKEFAMFREAERERTEQIFRQARILKIIAVLIAFAVFVLVGVWAFVFFKMQSRTFHK